jgi:hypothetical protein
MSRIQLVPRGSVVRWENIGIKMKKSTRRKLMLTKGVICKNIKRSTFFPVVELRERNFGYRILTWTDGFYNGEVKTTKIANSAKLTANQLIMRRSEQLRELYEALCSGKCDRRAARPVASLSPEDLGNTEWYYMVSMTYAFRPGQGYLY